MAAVSIPASRRDDLTLAAMIQQPTRTRKSVPAVIRIEALPFASSTSPPCPHAHDTTDLVPLKFSVATLGNPFHMAQLPPRVILDRVLTTAFAPRQH
jgi:hypothetical protein